MERANKQADELASIISEVQAERQKVEPFYQAASKHVTPLYADWCSNSAELARVSNFSNAGIRAASRFASFIHGMATPAQQAWFSLEDLDEALNDQHDVRLWYSDATQAVRSAMFPQFYKASRNAFLQMSVSYGAMMIHERTDKEGTPMGEPIYRHVSSRSIWYLFDDRHQLDCVVVEHSFTKKQVLGFLGTDDFVELKAASDRASFWHIVRRENEDQGFEARSEEKPFQGYWLSPCRKKVVKTEGFNEMPYVVFQWEQVPGLSYSVGPAYEILPEIVGADKARELWLRASAWAGNPAVLGPNRDSIRGRGAVMPGTMVHGGMIRGDAQYGVLAGVADPRPFLDGVIDAEARVREAFSNHDMHLGQTGRDMTATEVAERTQERALMMGPFGISMHDGLQSVVERTLRILVNAGRVARPPEVLMERGDYHIAMTGPLHEAVKQVGVARMVQAMQTLMFLQDVEQRGGSSVVNMEKAARYVLDQSGIDPEIEVSEKELAQQKAEQQAAEQQMMQAQQLQMEASAARDGAAAVKDLSGVAAG